MLSIGCHRSKPLRSEISDHTRSADILKSKIVSSFMTACPAGPRHSRTGFRAKAASPIKREIYGSCVDARGWYRRRLGACGAETHWLELTSVLLALPPMTSKDSRLMRPMSGKSSRLEKNAHKA